MAALKEDGTGDFSESATPRPTAPPMPLHAGDATALQAQLHASRKPAHEIHMDRLQRKRMFGIGLCVKWKSQFHIAECIQ